MPWYNEVVTKTWKRTGSKHIFARQDTSRALCSERDQSALRSIRAIRKYNFLVLVDQGHLSQRDKHTIQLKRITFKVKSPLNCLSSAMTFFTQFPWPLEHWKPLSIISPGFWQNHFMQISRSGWKKDDYLGPNSWDYLQTCLLAPFKLLFYKLQWFMLWWGQFRQNKIKHRQVS